MRVGGSRSAPRRTRSSSGHSSGGGMRQMVSDSGVGALPQTVTFTFDFGSSLRYPERMAGGQRDEQTGGAVKERTGQQTKEPTLYSVVLLNDDYTPMQFVVDVLE